MFLSFDPAKAGFCVIMNNMKSDQELRKTFKVFINKDDILNIAFLKELKDPEDSIRQTELIEEEVLKIFNENSQKRYNILVDLSALNRRGINIPPAKTRKIFTRLSIHKQVAKVAYVGGSILIKTIAGFILQAAGKSENMKWFADKEEALKWLKEP